MRLELKSNHNPIHKNYTLPGDKSIAHRALIIGTLGEGEYKIENFPKNLDCLSTLKCMNQLGVKTKFIENKILVSSPGYENFEKNVGTLNANNSGTTARLISGLAAGNGINCIIDGDNSLKNRPMDRVIVPLQFMGAYIKSNDNKLPMEVTYINKLKGINYNMPVDSAQVKSCILIAGFLSDNTTTVIEKESTRDHTERMFKALGADIHVQGKDITIKNSLIKTKDMYIPGDISSAAFLICCTILNKNSYIKIENILLNERRRSYLDILISMGANIQYNINNIINEEPVGYIEAKSSSLHGIVISREDVPNIIDEIPVLAVTAAFSSGTTVIQGINELKYKESNRIKSIAENLINCGMNLKHNDENMDIYGNDTVINKQVYINPYNDHRIALAFLALAVRNLGITVINNWECTRISFPNAEHYFKDFLNINAHL